MLARALDTIILRLSSRIETSTFDLGEEDPVSHERIVAIEAAVTAPVDESRAATEGSGASQSAAGDVGARGRTGSAISWRWSPLRRQGAAVQDDRLALAALGQVASSTAAASSGYHRQRSESSNSPIRTRSPEAEEAARRERSPPRMQQLRSLLTGTEQPSLVTRGQRPSTELELQLASSSCSRPGTELQSTSAASTAHPPPQIGMQIAAASSTSASTEIAEIGIDGGGHNAADERSELQRRPTHADDEEQTRSGGADEVNQQPARRGDRSAHRVPTARDLDVDRRSVPVRLPAHIAACGGPAGRGWPGLMTPAMLNGDGNTAGGSGYDEQVLRRTGAEAAGGAGVGIGVGGAEGEAAASMAEGYGDHDPGSQPPRVTTPASPAAAAAEAESASTHSAASLVPGPASQRPISLQPLIPQQPNPPTSQAQQHQLAQLLSASALTGAGGDGTEEASAAAVAMNQQLVQVTTAALQMGLPYPLALRYACSVLDLHPSAVTGGASGSTGVAALTGAGAGTAASVVHGAMTEEAYERSTGYVLDDENVDVPTPLPEGVLGARIQRSDSSGRGQQHQQQQAIGYPRSQAASTSMQTSRAVPQQRQQQPPGSPQRAPTPGAPAPVLHRLFASRTARGESREELLAPSSSPLYSVSQASPRFGSAAVAASSSSALPVLSLTPAAVAPAASSSSSAANNALSPPAPVAQGGGPVRMLDTESGLVIVRHRLSSAAQVGATRTTTAADDGNLGGGAVAASSVTGHGHASPPTPSTLQATPVPTTTARAVAAVQSPSPAPRQQTQQQQQYQSAAFQVHPLPKRQCIALILIYKTGVVYCNAMMCTVCVLLLASCAVGIPLAVAVGNRENRSSSMISGGSTVESATDESAASIKHLSTSISIIVLVASMLLLSIAVVNACAVDYVEHRFLQPWIRGRRWTIARIFATNAAALTAPILLIAAAIMSINALQSSPNEADGNDGCAAVTATALTGTVGLLLWLLTASIRLASAYRDAWMAVPAVVCGYQDNEADVMSSTRDQDGSQHHVNQRYQQPETARKIERARAIARGSLFEQQGVLLLAICAIIETASLLGTGSDGRGVAAGSSVSMQIVLAVVAILGCCLIAAGNGIMLISSLVHIQPPPHLAEEYETEHNNQQEMQQQRQQGHYYQVQGGLVIPYL